MVRGSTVRSGLASARVAIVHDWLPVYAGAERVLEQILAVLPQADVYTLIDFVPAEERGFLGGRRVTTSFIQRLPFARRYYRHYVPLAPIAVEQFDLRAYDLVVSSSYVVAKAALTTAQQLHISYIHSPVRYAWDLYFQYLEESGLRRGIRSAVVRSFLHYLRQFDIATTGRVDCFIANSAFVSSRIAKIYRRESTVIHPPVDVDGFSIWQQKEDYYLTVSRLVPYKRVDIIVEAFASMPDKRLLVVGDGPDARRIASKAGPNVTMLGHQPGERVYDLMKRARAFVFAAEEDFGIVSCEAQATGTPVIAYGSGGALETVVDGETGLFFGDQSPEAVAAAVRRFEAIIESFEPEVIRRNVLRFSAARFRDEFEAFVAERYEEFQHGMMDTAGLAGGLLRPAARP